MKKRKTIGLLSGLAMVICMSLVPNLMARLVPESGEHLAGKGWAMTAAFLGAAVGALVIARSLKQTPPKRKHTLKSWALALVGLPAAVYFVIVYVFDPPTADWLEMALTMPFVILFGIWWLKERPAVEKWLGAAIALLGYLVMLPALAGNEAVAAHQKTGLWLIVLGILLPLIGALGSALSVHLMNRLRLEGMGRFYAMSIRYALVGIVMIPIALLWDPSGFIPLMVLGTFAVGLILINGSLYFALLNLEYLGSVSLGSFLLMVPVFTTVIAKRLLNNQHPESFYIGAALILAGAAFAEFAANRVFKKSKPGPD